MGQVIQFPGEQEREWNVWEQTIRETNVGTLFDNGIIDAALPAIREHWLALFQSITLQVPSTEIPAPLSDDQVRAIQLATDRCAETMTARLKQERLTAMGRLISAELKLEYFRKHGFL